MPRPTPINSHIIIGAVPNDSRRNRLIWSLLEMRLVDPGQSSVEERVTPGRAVIQASISQGLGVGNRDCRHAPGVLDSHVPGVHRGSKSAEKEDPRCVQNHRAVNAHQQVVGHDS